MNVRIHRACQSLTAALTVIRMAHRISQTYALMYLDRKTTSVVLIPMVTVFTITKTSAFKHRDLKRTWVAHGRIRTVMECLIKTMLVRWCRVFLTTRVVLNWRRKNWKLSSTRSRTLSLKRARILSASILIHRSTHLATY